jgi:hypothetical protein
MYQEYNKGVMELTVKQAMPLSMPDQTITGNFKKNKLIKNNFVIQQ